jgi:hypothetical protein
MCLSWLAPVAHATTQLQTSGRVFSGVGEQGPCGVPPLNSSL